MARPTFKVAAGLLGASAAALAWTLVSWLREPPPLCVPCDCAYLFSAPGHRVAAEALAAFLRARPWLLGKAERR